MTLESFKNYCLAKPGVEDHYPFRGECAWMKVGGKMFGMVNVTELKMGDEIVPPFHFANLKCNPEKAEELRASHAAIRPGWHQSKKHWNSLYFDGSLPDELVFELIDHAYDLVAATLPKKVKAEFRDLENNNLRS